MKRVIAILIIAMAIVAPALATFTLTGTSITDHGVLIGYGTNEFISLAVATNGQLLIGQTGADPNFKTVSGDVTIDEDGAVTIANSAVETAMIADANVTLAKMADESIDSDQYVDGSIDTAHLSADCVTSAKLDEGTIQYTSIDVNEAELEALNGTPKELVAAPGSGKAIEFISAAIFYDHSTADYTTQGDLTIYSGTTATAVSDTIAGSDMILGSADAYRIVQALSADVQLDVNESIVIKVDTANPTDPGTAAGALTVKVAYRIHDFN